MSSQTLLRNLLEAALAADLSKNEWKVFAVLLKQTLGFGKRRDPLTTKRIATLSGIRSDRVQPALDQVLKSGLYEATPHAWLDHTYAIAESFFEAGPIERFFAPSLPESGQTSPATAQTYQKVVTYRDTTSTEIENTDNSASSSRDLANAVEVEQIPPTLTKPENLPAGDFQQLLPALKKLPNTQALDVLKLVSAAISDQSIKTTPVRLGYGLIKAAQNGTLNTAPLRERETQILQAQQREQAAKTREQAEAQRLAALDKAHWEKINKLLEMRR